MNYAYDAAAWQVEEAYLFGDEYIVAPCMEKNKTSVVVYFPALSGRWIHLVYLSQHSFKLNYYFLIFVAFFIRNISGEEI